MLYVLIISLGKNYKNSRFHFIKPGFVVIIFGFHDIASNMPESNLGL